MRGEGTNAYINHVHNLSSQPYHLPFAFRLLSTPLLHGEPGLGNLKVSGGKLSFIVIVSRLTVTFCT